MSWKQTWTLLVIAGSVANAGTISFFSRDAWQAAAGPLVNETFSNPIGSGASLDFGAVSLTSIGHSSASSSDLARVIKVNTSYIDLLPTSDGGNYVGTVGRTAASSTTVTTTASEWCKNGVCTQSAFDQSVQFSDYSDVRSLMIGFHDPTFDFGFDYIAYLSGSSPNRTNHAFRMHLSFLDGTTSSVWVGGPTSFSPYEEGFMGIIADEPIISAEIVAPDRSIGSNSSVSGGDWQYQLTKPKRGDFYTYSLSQTVSSDQSDALLLGNLSVTTPELSPSVGLLFGCFCIAALRRRRMRRVS